jgi:hypothetical protein
MRRATIVSFSLPLALCFALPLALVPAAGAEPAWDDSHMRSNFARQRGPAPPRPPIQGTDRYHQATENPTSTPPTSVAETTLRISPHEWTPGGPTLGGGNSAPPWARGSGGYSLGGAAPSVSSGIRGSSAGLSRGSLRSGSMSSR